MHTRLGVERAAGWKCLAVWVAATAVAWALFAAVICGAVRVVLWTIGG